ncbi:hypothetical protein DSO57_1000969 [Entomophthora muscae]|uniref:Uncharacterized protein n=1 Tax=Entomophthora muscae TaxID=34485 RepID=A0ACC2UIX1_9FUNG|nr:hypothetical protein DSO57_1000969 [Entomophthora muscae]
MKAKPDLIWGTMFGKFSTLDCRHRRVLEMVFFMLDKSTIALGNVSFFVLGYLMLIPKRLSAIEWLVMAWAVVEVLFHLYVRVKLTDLESARPVAVVEGEDRIRLAKQTCEHMEDVALDLGGWHKEGKDIHFGHVEEWLVHMFFAKPHEELNSRGV